MNPAVKDCAAYNEKDILRAALSNEPVDRQGDDKKPQKLKMNKIHVHVPWKKGENTSGFSECLFCFDTTYKPKTKINAAVRRGMSLSPG